MSNTLELARRVGQAGLLAFIPSPSQAAGVARWQVRVRVIDARAAWGNDRLRVSPIDDAGNLAPSRGPAVWVDAARVTLDPEQRP